MLEQFPHVSEGKLRGADICKMLSAEMTAVNCNWIFCSVRGVNTQWSLVSQGLAAESIDCSRALSSGQMVVLSLAEQWLAYF